MLDLLTQAAQPLTLQLHSFERVNLTLVGCGGTGSHLASGLVSIAQTLRDRDVEVDLTFMDGDIVEEKNVGRQLFSAGDIGANKADVLSTRLNMAFGERIQCAPRHIEPSDTFVRGDRWSRCMNLVVGAVDNPAARAKIAEQVGQAHGNLWWLDCGNERHSGQVAVGNACNVRRLIKSCELGMIDQLPAPHVVYPDLVATPKAAKGTKRQSCAELTAAGEQGLMVNRMVAAWANAMLHDLLITRDLKYFAVAFDLQWGGSKSYPIDLPTLKGIEPGKGSKHG